MSQLNNSNVSAIITDVDNTLFDWVDIWYRSFSAMLDIVVEKSGTPRNVLEQEIRSIHQRHGTSEYTFLIEEIPSLREKHGNVDLAHLYDDAIHAYNEARKAALKLYPRVRETLQEIRDKGTYIVAYTESMEFVTSYRFRKLGLDELIDCLYHPADHSIPQNLSREQLRRYSADTYKLSHTVSRTTPAGEIKPNPKLLLDIVNEVGASSECTIYVGDSLMKDVAMAQDAGITDVWAKYGVAQNRPEYELLRRVTHWTDADVQRERALTARHVTASFVLDQSFSQLLTIFKFEKFSSTATSIHQ